MSWYSKIVDDLGNLPDCLDYYNNELLQARKHCVIYGNVEKNIASLPGVTEVYFSHLQEIEAILRLLELKLRKIRRDYFQKYLEGYARALTSRDAEKYVEGEQDVIDFETLMNEVALVRNRYLSILKGLESKSFSLSNLVRLKCAGMEDFTV